MEIKFNYTSSGDLNAITIEEMTEHLVEKKGTLKVWNDKNRSYALYKIRYRNLHEFLSTTNRWERVDCVTINRFSILEYLN